MTGNAPDLKSSPGSPAATTRSSTSTTPTASASSASGRPTSRARTACAETASSGTAASRTTASCSSPASRSRTRRSRPSSPARPTSRSCSRPPRRRTSTRGPSPTASLATVLAGFDVNEARGDAIRADLWRKTDEVLRCLDDLGVHTPNRSASRSSRCRSLATRTSTRRALPLRQRHLRNPGRLPPSSRRARSGSGSRSPPRTPRPRSSSSSTSSGSSPTPSTYGRPGRNTRREPLAGIDWRGRVWLIYLAVGVVLTAAYLWFPPLKGNGPLINLLGLSSSIAVAVGDLPPSPQGTAAWVLFIVGQFLFFAGDLYTYSYPKLTGVEVEFPSIGDAIYLTVYPALVAGLLVLVRRRNPQGDRAGVIDSLIISGRHRAALVGLPRRPEHPPLRA